MSPITACTDSLNKFEQQVLPALEGHWMQDSHAVSFLEQNLPVPSQSSACGQAAIEALLGSKAASYVRLKEDKLWTNRTEMESALRRAGAEFDKRMAWWPRRGLCLIQWQGPWLDRSFRGSDLKLTHWVSVANDYVYDVNWAGWLPKHVWEDVVVYELLSEQEASFGWRPLTGYEI